MADLPPGKGHAKHSDKNRVEATPPAPAKRAMKVPSKAQAEKMAAAMKAQQPRGMHVRDLASAVAAFQVDQAQRDYEAARLQNKLLTECAYYLRKLCDAQGLLDDEELTKAIDSVK